MNAIAKAEEELQHGRLYCIGDIVHNSLEIERLKRLGLSTIDHDEFARLKACRVLFGLMVNHRVLMSWQRRMELR